ncbi:MAG: glycosyltransferase family 4 protein [Candidatus Zixiibacteriota bacterium]|nr:MAG: glycosyltransferase family 4 protein [candidate division Zixibacteria bacterium]
MIIAQVAPLYESVPPKLYGGTERVVSYLTEELVRQGHNVVLYASGDSVTSADLVACSPQALRLDSDCRDMMAPHILMIEKVFQNAPLFDIIHFHIDYLHYPISRRTGIPQVTTLHGRLDLPELERLYREYTDMPVISISDSQTKPLPWANWQGTIHHGLPHDLVRFHEWPGDYLAVLGRISPEKRVDRAIAAARQTGLPLKIAAKVDKADEEYFKAEIKPLLDDPSVEYVGEIGEADKDAFLGGARALLFLIDWPEPFGLVMIEALAAGTPVIAYPHGSVPEIIEEGRTGFLVSSLEETVRAIHRLPEIRRRDCRQAFEERFSVERMARDYLAIYEQVILQSRIMEPATSGGTLGRYYPGQGPVLHPGDVGPGG